MIYVQKNQYLKQSAGNLPSWLKSKPLKYNIYIICLCWKHQLLWQRNLAKTWKLRMHLARFSFYRFWSWESFIINCVYSREAICLVKSSKVTNTLIQHSHKGSGTLPMLKCPGEIFIFGMWNNCPHPYSTLTYKVINHCNNFAITRFFQWRTLHVRYSHIFVSFPVELVW